VIESVDWPWLRWFAPSCRHWCCHLTVSDRECELNLTEPHTLCKTSESVDWPWLRWFAPSCRRWCCGASRHASACLSGVGSDGRRSLSQSHPTPPTNLKYLTHHWISNQLTGVIGFPTLQRYHTPFYGTWTIYRQNSPWIKCSYLLVMLVGEARDALSRLSQFLCPLNSSIVTHRIVLISLGKNSLF